MHRTVSQPTPPATAFIPNKSVQHIVPHDPDFDTEVELPPLDTVIPKDMLRKLKPKEKKRQEVINGSSLLQFMLDNSLNPLLHYRSLVLIMMMKTMMCCEQEYCPDRSQTLAALNNICCVVPVYVFVV